MILVTGANGFVGSTVLRRLAGSHPGKARATYRSTPVSGEAPVDSMVLGEIGARTDWRAALMDVEVIVHTAARVHIMHDTVSQPLDFYRRVNAQGTLNLARHAAAAGVKRLIFLSSIKVNGESTDGRQPFRADDPPDTTDPYAQSKLEAEAGLLALAKTTGLEVVIIRPVLAYGPGVKGNFRTMIKWIEKGIPLPFASIQNRRSLVSVDNLVDLIVTCVDHPAAANQIFLVSDGEDLSTPDLLRRTARALGKPARIFPFPTSMLSLGARALGRGEVAQRLCGSLQVDIEKNRQLLNWSPPVTVNDGLQRMAATMKGTS